MNSGLIITGACYFVNSQKSKDLVFGDKKSYQVKMSKKSQMPKSVQIYLESARSALIDANFLPGALQHNASRYLLLLIAWELTQISDEKCSAWAFRANDSAQLLKDHGYNKDQKYLNDELYQRFKRDFEPQVGEMLLTKDATPGIAYVVKESIEGIISGGILRLKVKTDSDQEYLALCINSIIGKWQAERDAGGSVIAHWKPEQIRSLLIPILPKSTQEKIAELVRKSHEARKKSKELLEKAKRKVEEMIEKGDIID